MNFIKVTPRLSDSYVIINVDRIVKVEPAYPGTVNIIMMHGGPISVNLTIDQVWDMIALATGQNI